jgi:hypothetical protein
MTAKELEQCEEEWQAAEKALRAARQMVGSDRYDALRKAGQMRYDADRLRYLIEQLMEKRGKQT